MQGRQILFGASAGVVGLLAGLGHWLAKPGVVLGTCIPHMFCPAGDMPRHLVSAPVGADDLLIGLAAAIAAYLLLEVVLAWRSRLAPRTPSPDA